MHKQIFEALDHQMPRLSHLSLLSSKNQEISKRLGGFDIESLRNIGVEPMTINSFLSKIGTSDQILPQSDLSELIKSFDITTFGKSPSNYDQKELEKLNLKVLHSMPYSIAKMRLQQEGLSVIEEDFWNIVRSNISNIREVNLWWDICNKVLEPSLNDYSFTRIASSVLPPEPWDISTWDLWINDVKKLTQKSGRDLFMPIRIALTGFDHGPELKLLLPMIGYNRAKQRLIGISA